MVVVVVSPNDRSGWLAARQVCLELPGQGGQPVQAEEAAATEGLPDHVQPLSLPAFLD